MAALPTLGSCHQEATLIQHLPHLRKQCHITPKHQYIWLVPCLLKTCHTQDTRPYDPPTSNTKMKFWLVPCLLKICHTQDTRPCDPPTSIPQQGCDWFPTLLCFATWCQIYTSKQFLKQEVHSLKPKHYLPIKSSYIDKHLHFRHISLDMSQK